MNAIWANFLRGILKMPGAKIDREKFLYSTFSKLPPHLRQAVVAKSPADVLPLDEIEKVAKKLINSQTKKVAVVSGAAGIPGGVGMLLSIPADLANFYYHVVTIGQKIGYLYGYPDMLDDKEKLTEQGKLMLTAFIGVMNNVTAANEIIKRIASETARRVGDETATRIAGKILQKQVVSQAVETVTQKLGTQITAKTGGKAITRAIPLVSGLVCGVVTYRTFKPAAIRLNETLKQLAAERKFKAE